MTTDNGNIFELDKMKDFYLFDEMRTGLSLYICENPSANNEGHKLAIQVLYLYTIGEPITIRPEEAPEGLQPFLLYLKEQQPDRYITRLLLEHYTNDLLLRHDIVTYISNTDGERLAGMYVAHSHDGYLTDLTKFFILRQEPNIIIDLEQD